MIKMNLEAFVCAAKLFEKTPRKLSNQCRQLDVATKIKKANFIR